MHGQILAITSPSTSSHRLLVGEYYFFVDIDGHAADKKVARALAELQEHCTLMTVLGSYPKAEV